MDPLILFLTLIFAILLCISFHYDKYLASLIFFLSTICLLTMLLERSKRGGYLLGFSVAFFATVVIGTSILNERASLDPILGAFSVLSVVLILVYLFFDIEAIVEDRSFSNTIMMGFSAIIVILALVVSLISLDSSVILSSMIASSIYFWTVL